MTRRTRVIVGQIPTLIVAVGLGTALFVFRGRPESELWSVGRTVTAKVTLITSDRSDLDCAYAKETPAGRCAFRSPGERYPTGNDPLLEPYATVDHKIILLPDLFEHSAVHERYRKEPPQGRPRERLKRFTVNCVVELVGRPSGVQVRFRKDDAWTELRRVWVGKATRCAL